MSTYYQQESRFGFSQAGVTYSVRWIILANVLVFVAQLLLDIPFGRDFLVGEPGGEVFFNIMGFSTERFVQGWVWGAVTYMFVHGGLQHLFFNMFLLFLFGPEVERVLGTRQFLRFYFFCGVAGVLVNLLMVYAFRMPPVSVIGASGAVTAVVVAFAMVDPDRQIYLLPLPFPITARAMVIVFIVINLLTAAGGGSGTSVVTHLGGMAAGFLYMKYRPKLAAWTLRRKVRRTSLDKKQEDMGKAIDNIFKFGDKKKRN